VASRAGENWGSGREETEEEEEGAEEEEAGEEAGEGEEEEEVTVVPPPPAAVSVASPLMSVGPCDCWGGAAADRGREADRGRSDRGRGGGGEERQGTERQHTHSLLQDTYELLTCECVQKRREGE
jgi:hypothetical protein